MRRGDWIRTAGGGEGLYVGTSANGVEWVAYDRDAYRVMCRAFDEQENRRVMRK